MTRFNMTIYPEAPPAPAPPEPEKSPRPPMRPFLRGMWVTLFFVALTILFIRPISLHPASMVLAKSTDPILNSWIVGWVSRAAFTHPTQLFEGNISYPLPHVLAYTENMVGVIPIAAPVFWLTGNALLAHNLVLLSFYVFSGVSTYLLVRYLTGNTAAGIVAGVIFAFCPYQIGQISHIQELSAGWMPLTLLFLHRALATKRWRNFIGFGCCFTMQALSCLYYAVYFSFAVALFLLCVLLFRRRTLNVSVVGKFIAVGIVSGAILLPFSLPYARAEQEGFQRPQAETVSYSAALEDYLAVAPGNMLYGSVLGRRATNNAEHILFPGILPVVLSIVALAGLLPFLRRRDVTVNQTRDGSAIFEPLFYAFLAVVAFALSFGPDFHMMGKTYDFPMPYRLFASVMPGAKGMRVPSRFDVLVMLSLAVLAGYGAARLFARGRVATILAALAVAIVCAEFYKPTMGVHLPSGGDIPAVYRWLAAQPRETIVTEIPCGSEDLNARYEYFSTYHWLRIANGHSRLPIYLDPLPDAKAIDLLHAIDCNLLIFHPGMYRNPAAAAPVRKRLDNAPELELIQTFADDGDRVYRVRPLGDSSSASARSVRFELIVPRLVKAGETFPVPVRTIFPTPVGTIFKGDRLLTGNATWDAAATQPLKCRFADVVDPGTIEKRALTISAPTTLGTHTLMLRLSGPAATIEKEAKIEVVQSLANSLQKAGHHATISATSPLPLHVAVGERVRIDCDVRNDGETIWLPKTTEDGRGSVGLRVRTWTDAQGKEARGANGAPLEGRLMLDRPLWPGQSLLAALYANVPPVPGTYKAKIDLCSEWVMWFGDAGVANPCVVDVIVR